MPRANFAAWGSQMCNSTGTMWLTRCFWKNHHHHLQFLKCAWAAQPWSACLMQTKLQMNRVKCTITPSVIAQGHHAAWWLHKAECYLTLHWGQLLEVWIEETPFQIIIIIFLFYPGFLCNYNAMVWIDINNNAAMKMLKRVSGGNRSISVLTIKCNICYLK